MLRRSSRQGRDAGASPREKKKPAPKRGLKVLKEDVVGTYAAGAHPSGTVPVPSARRAAGSRFRVTAEVAHSRQMLWIRPSLTRNCKLACLAELSVSGCETVRR